MSGKGGGMRLRLSCSIGKRKRRTHTVKEGDKVDLSLILFTEQRDYLIKKSYPKVQAKHLKGKIVVLYFVPLLPLTDTMRLYISNLVDIYNEIQPKHGFEVVFIGVVFRHSKIKLLPNSTLEKHFHDLYSVMPWTAIPFSDSESRKYLARKFSVSPHISDLCPFSVAIDPKGLVLNCGIDHLFRFYGARGYPFSPARFKLIFSEDSEDKKHPSITKLLTSPERDFLINKDKQLVPVQNIENKVVALYFYEDDLYEPLEDDELTKKIKKVYEQLAEKDLDFEVVLVYMYETLDTILSSKESFQKRLNTMPWLALPYKDPVCLNLMGVAQSGFPLCSSGPDPRLAIIDPRRKVFEPYGADIMCKFGISAYPFTRQRVAELQVERVKKLKLDMFFDLNTTFTQKNGTDIQLSQLGGKRIILMIEEGWSTKYAQFWRRLKARYIQLKGTEEEFQVIDIPIREEKDVANEGSLDGEDFPNLRHPPLSSKSNAARLLGDVFNIVYGLVAFDRDGSVVRRALDPSIDKNNMDFPFYAAGMEKEVLSEIIYTHRWDR